MQAQAPLVEMTGKSLVFVISTGAAGGVEKSPRRSDVLLPRTLMYCYRVAIRLSPIKNLIKTTYPDTINNSEQGRKKHNADQDFKRTAGVQNADG